MKLVLASASQARQALLANAGLPFVAIPAELDERAAEQPLIEAAAEAQDVAIALAAAKAVCVSKEHPQDLVLGADQILTLEGERMTKPANMEAARRQLLRLSGKTHALHSAVASARNGEPIWQHAETAYLKMRRLTPEDIGHYLAATGSEALRSVGAYQIEGRGIQLFDEISGDYFAILGLPLLPTLAHLRAEGMIE